MSCCSYLFMFLHLYTLLDMTVIIVIHYLFDVDISLSPSLATLGLSKCLGSLGKQMENHKKGWDWPSFHPPSLQIFWCTGDSVRNQFVHVWRCFASFGAANVNKKMGPMSRWGWWLQHPVGDPQVRKIRRCRGECALGILHAYLFTRDWKTIWKKKDENPSNSKETSTSGIHKSFWNPSDGTCIDLYWNFQDFHSYCQFLSWPVQIDQAQHGAETKQHQKWCAI